MFFCVHACVLYDFLKWSFSRLFNLPGDPPSGVLASGF